MTLTLIVAGGDQYVSMQGLARVWLSTSVSHRWGSYTWSAVASPWPLGLTAQMSVICPYSVRKIHKSHLTKSHQEKESTAIKKSNVFTNTSPISICLFGKNLIYHPSQFNGEGRSSKIWHNGQELSRYLSDSTRVTHDAWKTVYLRGPVS